MVRKADDQMLTKAKRVEFVRVTNKTNKKNEIQNKAKKKYISTWLPSEHDKSVEKPHRRGKPQHLSFSTMTHTLKIQTEDKHCGAEEEMSFGNGVTGEDTVPESWRRALAAETETETPLL